jgi:phenylacetic acid degradation operon negative regulatory protein
VLPTGGSAWTASFLDLFGRLGIEQKAARQALMRTAGDGWLAAERVGRRTCWHLTTAAVELLTDGTERIYAFTATQQDWDGRWLVVLARVPERNRAARHLLRTRFAWAGFGSVGSGVWVSTRADRRADAERVLAEAGILADALIIDGKVIAGQQPAEVVARAWDLVGLEAGYQRFLGEFRPPVAADPLARLTELVHAWRRFPWKDPGLPPDLLPARWHGTRAARLFADRHAAWSPAARAEWAAIEAGATR